MNHRLGLLKEFIDVKRELRMDPESLERIQAERLGRLLGSAATADHYAGLLSGHGLEEAKQDICLLPPLEKSFVRDTPGSLIAKGANRGSLISVKTSGSTGMPLEVFAQRDLFAKSKARRYAAEFDIGRTPFNVSAQVHHTAHGPFFLDALGILRKRYYSVFDDEERNLEAVRRDKVALLGGYTSAISVMASLNQRKGGIKLASAYCYGEVLSKETRRMIQDSFSCPVYEYYGSNEFGIIAWECPEERNLHVCSSHFLLEVVDSKGKPTKGEGDILVSSLFNSAMPLLRYRLGDVGRWGRECACGRPTPTLRSLGGRNDDLLILPSGQVRSPFSLYCMYDIPGIRHYQIVQERPDLFLFKFVPSQGGLPASSKRTIVQNIGRACLGEPIKVGFEQVDSLEQGRTGKRRSVVCNVSKPRQDNL